MKLAAKISAGYGVLIALIVAVLSYQISLFYQMQTINRNLSGIDFRSAILSLELLRDLDQAEEFTRKFFATGGDPDYAQQMRQMRDAFSQRLSVLESLPISPQEKEEADSLSNLWRQLSQASADHEQGYRSMKPADAEKALSGQLELFSRMGIQIQSLIHASQRTIESRVEQSSEAGRRAQRISWVAAGAALLLSLVVSFWILRSISGPLRDLTAGTRAVAEGKFFYALDSSRNDELAELARDFNVMTRRLSELDILKKDFVSHVSHELKTPLASIEETIRLLLEEIPGPLNGEQRRFLELNLQSSRRLSSLIRNLLDLSRMDAGVMHYEMKQQDLGELVRIALAEFEAPFREKSLRLEACLPEQPIPVQCDRDRILQLLGNLLGNALKFSPRGGPLRVVLRSLDEIPANLPLTWRAKFSGTANRPGFALLEIADSGPGVPASEREKIFGKFYQVRQGNHAGHLSKSSGPGTGLGLAIGRTIVEAHRGAIWVEDNPGGGSVFSVLFAAGGVAEPAVIRTSSPV
jgi:two-component system, NtrC family, sensor histidine kinase GlrK